MPSSEDAPLPRHPQEVDAWYGSYSYRAMVPELVWFVLLTAALVSLALLLPARNLGRVGIVLLLALVWLVQVLVGIYSLLAFNYRVTNCRLFKEKGLFARKLEEMELARIGSVRVDQNGIGVKLGVGNIVAVQEGGGKTMILEGVRDPQQVLKHIQEMCRLAREQ